jgi:hypothetical protein
MSRTITYQRNLNNSSIYRERSTFPHPTDYQGNRKILKCSMSNCFFRCRTHVCYDAHVESTHFCEHCCLYCTNVQHHRCDQPNQRGGHVDEGRPTIDQSVFKEVTRTHLGAMVTYQYLPEVIFQDVDSIFDHLEKPLTKLFEQCLEIYVGLTVKLKLTMVLENSEYDKVETTYITSQHHDLHQKEEILELIIESAMEIITKLDRYNKRGSNWALREVAAFDVVLGSLRLLP